MSAADDDDYDYARVPAPVLTRLVPRKLSLRVSGARLGDAARPGAASTPAVAARAPRFGLRVHARFGVVPEVLPPVAEPRLDVDESSEP